MIRHTPANRPSSDTLSELYDVASALRFLEDALDSHDQAGTKVRSTGVAYISRLLGRRVSDIATGIWDDEDGSLAVRAASTQTPASNAPNLYSASPTAGPDERLATPPEQGRKKSS